MDIDDPKHLNITIDHDTGYVTMERFQPGPEEPGQFVSIAPLDKSEFACVHRSAPEETVVSFHGIPIEYVETLDDLGFKQGPNGLPQRKAD